MLTPQQLQGLPKPLTDAYSELSEFILRDIARRIAKAARITDTAQYQMYRARALGLSADVIAAEIARINGVSEKQIKQLIEQAAKTSDEFDRRMLGKEDSESVLADREQLQKLLRAQIEHTSGQCWNFTRSLGFAERNADGHVIISSLGDFMIDQMDAAHLKVINGVTDYNTAIRQACNALAASGVRTVYYNSGRSDRIEVAVRRALMTSVSQVTQKISEQNAEEFGADGWEISAHCGARPSHAVYQGRQYPNSQYETIVKPLIEDYNCRHSAYPVIMGLTKPSYTEGELAALDPPPFTYEGRTYTAYQAQQQMRKMERAMRKQKDLCIVADAMDDADTYTAASIRLRRQKDIYEDFCKAAGTYTEYERTFVAGYNRRLGAKTGAVTRKQRAFDKAQVRLTSITSDNVDVKDLYVRNATPNIGVLKYENGFEPKKYPTEVSFATWLHSTLGGDITMLAETKISKMADYLWNGKLWDLKSVTTEKAANAAVRKGLKQIDSNPGGIFLDFGNNDICLDELVNVIDNRMRWHKDKSADIFIVQNGIVVKVLRYTKRV